MPDASIQSFDLFWQAGPVVKGVIALLVLCSVWCWGIIMQCMVSVWRLKRVLGRCYRGENTTMTDGIFNAGQREAAMDVPQESPDARHRRIIGSMHRRVQELIECEQGGLANLAVIASVSPFIGLFGTVWGIMGSFIGIAAAKDTSLAVVAPGIAEALAATAMGLVAAIPAAFAYNRFASMFTRLGRKLARYIEDDVSRLLRDSHHNRSVM